MEKLIFVYNADSGKWSAYLDMAHKIFSPSTYPCSLCDLTYGIFKIRPEWDEFVKNSPIPFEFLHKDEFLMQYPHLKNMALPVVLKQENKAMSLLLDNLQLVKFETVTELKNAILSNI